MIGKNYKKNIPQPLLILIAILLSNALFYLLFFPSSSEVTDELPDGLVEIKLEAKLQTPFQKGKMVLIHHPSSHQMIEARLINAEEDGLVTVATDELSGKFLLKDGTWRILPLIKMNVTQAKGENREIRY